MEIRNILDRLALIEAQLLDANTITKREGRFDLFVKHIEQEQPFYTETGEEVIVDPAEASRVKDLMTNGQFKGVITLAGKDGTQWPLSKFLKTPPFGQAVPPGQEGGADGGDIGKEALVVKPSQIGIVDKTIRAGDLSKEIINNPSLRETEYGRVVIELAKQIVAGQPATLPKEYVKQKNIMGAIVDYAGEYLGVLAMIHGTSDFPKKAEFLKWLGGSMTELVLNFPSKANTPLADSFATVTDPDSDRQINISSKGQKGGAAPSVANLHVPDHIRKKKKYALAVDFIDLCSNKNLPTPASVSQVFLAMNLLEERRPDLVPEEFKEFLPWKQTIIAEVMNSVRNKTPLPRYEDLIKTVDSRGTDGGILSYVVKKAVMEAFNSGEITEFQDAVLEILDFNFVQQYADIEKKTGVIKFYTQWPAKLDGVVSLETKSGPTDPTKGAFSFKLKPPGGQTDTGPLPDDEEETTGASSRVSDVEVPNAVSGKRVKIKPKSVPTKSTGGNIGRELR